MRIGLLVSLAGLASGCTYFPVTSTARRDNSFTPLHGEKVGDISTKDYVASRTAFILVGDAISDELQSSGAGGQSIQFPVSSKMEFGCAVIIDERGYLLTAAHVVDVKPIMVLYFDGDIIRHQIARLVWNGSVSPGKPDLALLHVAAHLPNAFQGAERYEANDDVLAVGVNYADRNKPNFTMGFSGGKLGSHRPFLRTPTTETITSDLPLHLGDSGSPLVSSQGQLIAINVRVTLSRLEYLGIPRKVRSDAIRPDIAWLKRIIEEDFDGNIIKAPLRPLQEENAHLAAVGKNRRGAMR